MLKGLVGAGGLVLSLSNVGPCKALADARKYGGDGTPHGTVSNPHTFVS